MKNALFPRFLATLFLVYGPLAPVVNVSGDYQQLTGGQRGALAGTAGKSTVIPVLAHGGVQAAPAKANVVSDTDVTPVPEPEAVSMLLIGMGLIAFLSGRNRKNDKLR